MNNAREPPDTQPPNFRDDALKTNGIRANRDRTYDFTLTGPEVYWTLNTLEDLATNNPNLPLLRKCVLLSQRIREQAEQQGF